MWSPGDDPTTHPRWEDEVAIEQAMRDGGADRFREAAAKARGGKQSDGTVRAPRMTGLKPYRRLIEQWLPDMVEGIRDWIREVEIHQRRIGNLLTVVSLPYIKAADPYLSAYLTLRTVLDTMTIGQVGIMSAAKAIGLGLEHEARMLAWEKRDPDLWHRTQKHLRKEKATSVHRRKVNINRFNKLMREPLEWRDWSEHVRTRVGLDLIDILVRYTGQFTVGHDVEHVFRAGRTPRSPKAVLVAKPELLDWLTAQIDRAEVMSPMHWPTIIPPKRWEGTRSGGYHTPLVRTPHLIRFSAHQEDQRARAIDEYDAIDMPRVYKAIHTLQESAWSINRRILDVAKHFVAKDWPLAGLPRRTSETPEAPPEGIVEDEKTVRGRKRRNTALHRRNAMRASHVLSVDRTISIAERLQDETFFYPHMLDFRGRMYPIPQDLQPQARDLARGLLLAAPSEAKPVRGRAAEWLAIQVANTWGNDKISFEDRVAWVHSKQRTWRSIAKDPIKNRGWCEASEPWQALAAIIEWARYLDEGEGMLSALPIREDGTCNGIQHLSAMVRDAVGGASVNLVPGPTPRDIYKEVARRLQDRFEEIAASSAEDAELAQWWLDLCDGEFPRSLTKRQVMIMPYGGTRDAYFTYLRDWLEDEKREEWEAFQAMDPPFDPDLPKEEQPPRPSAKALGLMAKGMWAAVTETVSGGVATMEWLKTCAKGAAEGNQPVYWVTPSGFVVRHFYGKVKSRQLLTRIDGQTFAIRESVRTKELDIKDQLKGIPPNFVHSMDASALVLAVCKAADHGISFITAIHDAYGTVAADMWDLHHLLRDAFVEVYQTDVLANFRDACKEVLTTHIMAVERMEPGDRWAAEERADKALPEPLPRGSLDIEAVRDSPYFFA